MDKTAIFSAAAAAGLPRERVQAPEFGEGVSFLLQGMSGAERDAWERSLLVGRGRHRDINTDNVRARLVARCVINEDGTRVFSDSDAPAIGGWRADVVSRLYDAAQRLSGVRDEDVDELKKFSAGEAGSASPTS